MPADDLVPVDAMETSSSLRFEFDKAGEQEYAQQDRAKHEQLLADFNQKSSDEQIHMMIEVMIRDEDLTLANIILTENPQVLCLVHTKGMQCGQILMDIIDSLREGVDGESDMKCLHSLRRLLGVHKRRCTQLSKRRREEELEDLRKLKIQRLASAVLYEEEGSLKLQLASLKVRTGNHLVISNSSDTPIAETSMEFLFKDRGLPLLETKKLGEDIFVVLPACDSKQYLLSYGKSIISIIPVLLENGGWVNIGNPSNKEITSGYVFKNGKAVAKFSIPAEEEKSKTIANASSSRAHFTI